jgi:hypothetical protein
MLNASGGLLRSEVIDVSRLPAEPPGFPAQILQLAPRTLREAELAETTRGVIGITRNGKTTVIRGPLPWVCGIGAWSALALIVFELAGVAIRGPAREQRAMSSGRPCAPQR